ncbi:MAG: hydantoinase B/oxoprolinase family protein, partial [Gaiellaceae bacterium]
YMESYYPVVLERYEPVIDTGGPGLHRGGTGIEKQYMFRCAGEVTVNDDRALLSPWGLGGAKHGGQSSKAILRADGTREELPSKIDNVAVLAGDRIVFRSAGAGGWGDPLEREQAIVERDVKRRLVSAESAERDYGVVIGDKDGTEALRKRLSEERGVLSRFDFGELPAGLTPPS